MTQYNSLNVKLSNSQLNKLKSAIKNGTDVILRLSSNMIGNSDAEANFPHKLLLTNRQVANLRKAFANNTSTVIKLSEAQLTKMQKGGFLRFLAPLLKSGLPLLLGTLGVSLLGDMLAGRGAIKAGEGTIRAGYGSKTF